MQLHLITHLLDASWDIKLKKLFWKYFLSYCLQILELDLLWTLPPALTFSLLPVCSSRFACFIVVLAPTMHPSPFSLVSRSKATHCRLSGQLHPWLVSHLHVAMGTVLVVTYQPLLPPSHQQSSERLPPREASPRDFFFFLCVGVRGPVSFWLAEELSHRFTVSGSSARSWMLGDFCQFENLLVENCSSDVSELCGCCLFVSL